MSDLVVITPEVINDIEKAVNFFNVIDVKRKNRFLFQYFQDYYFKQKISFDKVLGLCRNILNNESSFTILLDNLYIFSQAILPQTEGRKQLIQLLQSLAERLTISQKQEFFDQFDEEILWECGFVQYDQFLQRKRKINTDINFIQNKYCLMKDENEGYSKMMVEILEAKQQGNIQIRIHNIIALIGYFDLDPDRVVDLTINCWIDSPYSFQYIEILRNFKQISISYFLGKKFEQILHTIQNNNLGIQSTPIENASQIIQTDPRVPPQNLIIVTALSIKFNLFQIGHIWKYLQPSDNDMCKVFEDLYEECFKYYKSFDQVMLVEDLKDQTSSITGSDKLKKELMGQQLYNQKLWLLQGLLQTNSIDQFTEIYSIFQNCIDLTCFQPIKQTLGDIIEWMIEPLYAAKFNSLIFPSRNRSQKQILYCNNSPTTQIPQFHSLNNNFYQTLTPIIKIYAPYIGENPVVFHKLMKVLQGDSNAISIVKQYLLAGLQSSDSLPLAQEVWKHISQLDFRQRYLSYSNLKDNQQFQSINQIIRSAELTKVHLRSFFNKIDKDNKDRMMMKFAKFSHTQSLIVMNQLRRNRLEISDNNPVIVHALGLLTPMSLDVMMFAFVQWLCDFADESKIKEKDIDCKFWFKNAAYFLAACLRKYYNVDMQGLFAYLLEVFTNTTTTIKPEILILRELIEKMTGIIHIRDLTPQQIQASAGGRYIQLETTSQTNEFRKSRKSSSALEQFFWSQTINSQIIVNQNNQQEVVSLAFLMLVVLCQQRSRFLLNYHSHNLKPLGELYDNYTCSINQLTKCLLFQTDKPTHYAQLFPKNPLQRMVIHYKIPFEIAFHIVRYSYKSLYNLTEEEFGEEKENIKNIYDQIEPQTMYQNPDYGDMSQLQVPQICHTYVKENLWNTVNPDLFTIFWLLSLDNIYIPLQVYEQQIKWLQENMSKTMDTKDRQTKQNVKAYEKLQNELENNKKRKEQFDKYLFDKKDVFNFKDIEKDSIIKFSQVLSQVCLLPRILIDPAEAIYCAKFVQTLLKIGKMKYTYTFYIPKEIIYYTLTYLQCATEQESVNLSIFTQQLILPFANWNDDAKFKSDLKYYFDVVSETYDREKNYIICQIFQKIALFIRILKNNETQVRNALLFLKRIQDIFPPTQLVAEQIKTYLMDIEKDYGHIADIKTQIKNYHIDEKINSLPQYAHKVTPATEIPKKIIQHDSQQPDRESQEPGQRINNDIRTKDNSKERVKDYSRDPHSKDREQQKDHSNGKKILSQAVQAIQKTKHGDREKNSREKDLRKKKSYDRERGPKKQGKQ